MSYIFNLIRTAFEWGLFLALIGGLGEATAVMYKESGNTRTHGLVSLSRLNRSLVGATSRQQLRKHAKDFSEDLQ